MGCAARAAWMLMALAAPAAVPAAAATAATRHTVVIENLQYAPASLTVRRGDTVVWVNRDLFPHTVTAGNGAFDSHSIAASRSWSYVARKSGEYAYGCSFHPTMKARLTVQ